MGLDVAVERLEEVIEEKPLETENTDAVVFEDMPLESILDMAKDPEASSQVLEIAVEKIKEVAVLNDMSDSNENLANALPMEVLLDMAKDPVADEQILEVAVEKIKDIQGQNEVSGNEQSIESLGKTLPMEILLEMAKDPEAKEQILEMAMERLKELQGLTTETEEAPVVLDPLYSVPRAYYYH